MNRHDRYGYAVIAMLRKLDAEGRRQMVAWMRSNDHHQLRAMAEPVERFCAALERDGE